MPPVSCLYAVSSLHWGPYCRTMITRQAVIFHSLLIVLLQGPRNLTMSDKGIYMLKIFLDGCLVHEILSRILENNVSSDFSLKSRFVPFKFSSHAL